MNLLTGAGALGSVLRGATGLVQALKQPKLSTAQFASVLNQQLELHRGSGSMNSTQALQTQAGLLSSKFVALRDANSDTMLRLDESGLDAARFAQLDVNKDGLLSQPELRTYAMANFAEASQVLK
jgi:hypothetical protein